MADAPDIAAEASRIDELYRAKARVEIHAGEAAAQPVGDVRGQGDVLAEVLLVKGEPGPDDLRTKRALSGEDGAAVGKALDALGLPKARFALCTASEGAPADGIARLRLLVEAIDPRTIVLLDARAAADFAAAFEIDVPPNGERVVVQGRTVVACEGFESSLGDEDAKRRVWKQLQALAPAGSEKRAPRL